MRTFEEKAFAKLNLYLGVRDLRPDGYHELVTVFQSIDLCDLVAISLHHRGEISLRCNLPYLPTDGRNLAVKAAEAFFRVTGLENPGLNINIKKVIPVGAGMAGGSTDAACVLRLLNRAFGMPLSSRRLAETALTLGADVPFCLFGGTALARGVGEKLHPLPPLPPCFFVVGKPGFSVSTADAFGLYDRQPPQDYPSDAPLREALDRGDLTAVAGSLYNALEAPVGGQRPLILRLRESLLSSGALGARMTGSGSAVYGMFAEEEAARAAARDLRGLCREVYLCRPLPGRK